MKRYKTFELCTYQVREIFNLAHFQYIYALTPADLVSVFRLACSVDFSVHLRTHGQ